MDCNTDITGVHVQSLHEMLREVTDRRAKRGRRYEVAIVLVILPLAKLASEQASPAQLLTYVQRHWRRDATLCKDACTVRHLLVDTILAVLNSAILALFAYCHFTNARRAMRTFAAFPERALALLTHPL